MIIDCDNKHVYTIKEIDDDRYPFAIVDEFGETVTQTLDYVLEECIRFGQSLCVGTDYMHNLKYTRILRYKMPGERWKDAAQEYLE